MDDARNTKKVYTRPTYTKSDLREDQRLGGKMMWRMTYERWELLIVNKQHRIEVDGGEQLGRHLSLFDNVATEEEEKF
jgi:hypothetical protein